MRRNHHTIQHRSFVNRILSNYTFYSLHPNTIYTIDISVVDIWKRSSKTTTITGRTLSLTSNEKISSHQIIDPYLIDQSIACYRLNQQLLLIEFNRTRLYNRNHIYNLKIYDHQDQLILTDNLYAIRQRLPIIRTSNSFIYQVKSDISRYKMKLTISTNQSEYLGSILNSCEDFYPIYSPLTCSMKSTKTPHVYHLTIYMQLYSTHKDLITLQPTSIFYRINRNHIVTKSIHDIQKVRNSSSCSSLSLTVSHPLYMCRVLEIFNFRISKATTCRDNCFHTIIYDVLVFF